MLMESGYIRRVFRSLGYVLVCLPFLTGRLEIRSKLKSFTLKGVETQSARVLGRPPFALLPG
jgi:hypothetical protein